MIDKIRFTVNFIFFIIGVIMGFPIIMLNDIGNGLSPEEIETIHRSLSMLACLWFCNIVLNAWFNRLDKNNKKWN